MSGGERPFDGRLLVKLRPSAALRAAESRVNLRPLYDDAAVTPGLGLDGDARWFSADMPAHAATPWDVAHERVADQLGVAASDVIFAEPDLIHDAFIDDDADAPGRLAAAGQNCAPVPQSGKNVPMGPHDGWHLHDDFSQLDSARSAVQFNARRTLIAQLDTGYDPAHVTVPPNLRRDLERSFVPGEEGGGAADPDGRALLDNSGHGTGTLSILAGGVHPGSSLRIGGAPDADVVPIRIADSVVLLRTSAFARALQYATDIGADVLSMSMGGLPSHAWREAVDRAYLAGVCMVTAAGNNFDGLPTRKIVYPARYSRVIAACGVMADGRPYARLAGRTMEGNFGPSNVMRHALAAYTPNIPWAVYKCPQHVRMNGAGTSSATPQIAAAAALWLEKHKPLVPRNWRRVEAVRKALFSTAAKDHPDEFGNGVLRAMAALGVAPDLTLPQTKSDSDSFAFLRVITGLGIQSAPPRERMFNLEIAQLWLVQEDLQEIVPEPDGDVSQAKLVRFMERILEEPRASLALRRHLADRYAVVAGKPPKHTKKSADVVRPDLPVAESQPQVPLPGRRRLNVFAVDPSYSTRLDTEPMNRATLEVRWEKLEPGPVGEYVAVEDVDIRAAPNRVDLDDARLLAQSGWPASEGNPQFHQQMVYAVAMNTIEHFERALGRPVLWRHARAEDPFDDSGFTRHLRIHPHALRQANAFYSPHDIALQFGYFEAGAESPADVVPGSRIYTCLSHDIVVHETTHAILDGMQRHYNQPSNPDVLAFHEAFSDIIALMQHFTIREVLEHEIRRTRGDLEAESMLGSLAVQFGLATSGRGALRSAIGHLEDGVWKRAEPDPRALEKVMAPHARGAILVAAVFDAFLAIYKGRIQDLLRLSTQGTGVLPNGAIHPDLVVRLADEAARSARHVLNICIRALDYMPPVDVTFFEYLRALITADYDLVKSDPHNYRVAFVEAFRRRGIYSASMADPANDALRTLSVDTLRWQGLDTTELSRNRQYRSIMRRLKAYANACLYATDRKKLFENTRQVRRALQAELAEAFAAHAPLMESLGLDSSLKSFEVHELRQAMRSSPDGVRTPQVVVSLLQTQKIRAGNGVPAHVFRGGSTVIVDLTAAQVKYCVVKRVRSAGRRERTAAFLARAYADPFARLLLLPEHEPFALLHSLEAHD